MSSRHLLVGVAALTVGCSQGGWTVDGFPIDLPPRGSSPSGGLLARATDTTASSPYLTIDTGSPLTFVRGRADGSAHMTRGSFDLFGDRLVGNRFPRRASFWDIGMLAVDLDPAAPDIVLGADVLRSFSMYVDFGAPALTLWSGQRAPESFLGAAQCAGSVADPSCFAVLSFDLIGGGELDAVSEPDFLGLTGPVEFAGTRLLLRACAAPAAADPVNGAETQPTCCSRADAAVLSSSVTPELAGYAPTGVDLALVLTTGLGPTVLAQSAWNEIVASRGKIPGAEPLPVPAPGPPLSFPALPAPLTDVTWVEVPRLALVDMESDPSTNPGACVELARARRLEWIERRRYEGKFQCTQPCDTDVREPTKAQNAAAYLERGGGVKVAIIPDAAPVLQAVRAELRQQGPQVDGFLGTDALGSTTMEVDYGASPARVVFSCAPGVDRATCLASPRCARQASPGDVHSCFGLPPLALPDPKTCEPLGCS
ncbi:MAG TPA: hypothetical protein VIU64_10450 [Polyangia bacterium]